MAIQYSKLFSLLLKLSMLLIIGAAAAIAYLWLQQEDWLPEPSKPFASDLSQPRELPHSDYRIDLLATDDLAFRLQKAVIEARPGTLIVLPEGRFEFNDELIINQTNITLAGKGMQKTILDFANQASGAQGILGLGDALRIQDLAVVNAPGDGIKTEGINHLLIQRTKVAWENGPSPLNGAYGLYPVQSKNIIIEDSHVMGASDAGIYVGQSSNIVVRRNTVEFNVAGIEIENSILADVYDNWTAYNTAGILVFDLPNLPVYGGRNTRVFNNVIFQNSTKNFAPAGNIVGIVPSGTGLMVMANDEIEIFGNLVRNHGTASLVVVSYLVTEIPLTDPNYEPYPESLWVHDNKFERPDRWYLDGSDFNLLPNLLFDMNPPEIVLDGIPKSYATDADAKAGQSCFANNTNTNGGAIRVGSMNLASGNTNFLGLPSGPALYDEPQYRCQGTALEPIAIEPWPTALQSQTRAQNIHLCNQTSTGVNWQAFEADCPNLADYGLEETLGYTYTLSTPLFSDYMKKQRTVFVPPNMALDYTSAGPLTAPIGTIIRKTFINPDSQQKIETRLLIHRQSGWVGLPYLWTQGEAKLHVGGATVAQSINRNGKRIDWNYQVPNKNQCGSCHQQGKQMQPIGLASKWLNHSNQLQQLSDKGWLSELPADATQWPQTVAWNDVQNNNLPQRARAYLDINCGHCHNPAGFAHTSGLALNTELPMSTQTGICKPPVAAGRGAGDLKYAIVPGDAEASILHLRMSSLDPAVKMPELSKGLVHEQGLALIKQWITQMPGTCEDSN